MNENFLLYLFILYTIYIIILLYRNKEELKKELRFK